MNRNKLTEYKWLAIFCAVSHSHTMFTDIKLEVLAGALATHLSTSLEWSAHEYQPGIHAPIAEVFSPFRIYASELCRHDPKILQISD